MKDGITKCDAIIRNATKKFQNKAWNFAEHYYNAPFLYIMASVLHMHRHTDLQSVLFRRCSGWTAVILIPQNISMDHLR